jgi:hypothetical protein
VLTAFGAWIGAGAAYFFGKESLRVSAEGLLAMRDDSPVERLRRTSVKQIPPRPLDWIVTRTTPLDDVVKKLEQESERWFVTLVKPDLSLDTVINEEAVWRYAHSLAAAPAGAPAQELGKVLDFIESTPDLKRFRDIHVAVTMDSTVGAANELMDSRSVALAIVETDGKPSHYFTGADVRRLVLQAKSTAAA